jgi:hypothetical protein
MIYRRKNDIRIFGSHPTLMYGRADTVNINSKNLMCITPV